MKNIEDVICPPCGEQPLAPEGFCPGVALATKRGVTKEGPILPLLPRLAAVLPPQGREIISRGFTLIELLVVVLIIAVLAAVALPQYQKAVLKSRFTQVESDIRALAQAAAVCKLEKGSSCTEEELDIEVPECEPIPGIDIMDTSCFYGIADNEILLLGKYHNVVGDCYFENAPEGLSTYTLYSNQNQLAKVGFTKDTGVWSRLSGNYQSR